MITVNSTMVYVYKLPEELSKGFCFGGGVPITFLNVDWFNGFDGMTQDDIRKNIALKKYITDGNMFLVLSPENCISFTMTGESHD